MFKWIIRKLGQLGNWSGKAAGKVAEVESKLSAWSLIDLGAGVLLGFALAMLVM